MANIKKYIWILLLNLLTVAVIFVPTGIYVYNKFGFASEYVEAGTRVSLMMIFFLLILGVYCLSLFNRAIKKIPNWKFRFALSTAYHLALVGAIVFLVNKICDTVNVLSENVLQTIPDLTKAIVVTSILFLVCYILSRISAFFSALMLSKIEDREILKSAERAEKALAKEKEKKMKKQARKKSNGGYLDQ